MDLRNKVVEFAYSSQALSTEMTKEFLDLIMASHLEKLERCKGTGPFMVGNNATAPDFSLW
jgi:hypothetical protein